MDFSTDEKRAPSNDSTIFSRVNDARMATAGIKIISHERKFGSIFFAISEQTIAMIIKNTGERDIPEPPSASIKAPAPMPQTTAVFCESSREIATTAPITISGMALRKESPEKKEH
jgi:hypothetical protein